MTTEEQEQAPETAVTQVPPAKQKTLDPEGRGELIKFGILILVFFAVIAGVALSRSLIFDRILPAIVQPVPITAPGSGVGGALEAPEGYPAPETGRELFLPSLVTEESGEEGETAVDTPISPTEEATAEPEPIIHVVQAGDTLSRIAQQHNVPVQALMEANGLLNPNYIQVGQTLLIPAAAP